MAAPEFKSMRDLLAADAIAEYAIVEIPSADETPHRKFRTDVNLTRFAYFFMQGYSMTQIAEALGIDKSIAVRIRSSEEFRAVLNTLSAEVIATAQVFLQASALKAVRTLIQSMDSSNEKVRLAASVEVLDRVGLKSPDKLEIIAKSDNLAALDDDQLRDLIRMNLAEILPLKEG